jgi:UDP-N-acetylglucosamine:LPS N-acetylglucosamine transferase
MARRLKVMAAASAGGHLMQLLKMKEAWDGCECVYVSTLDVVRKKLCKMSGRVYITGECNREHPLRMMGVLFKTFWIVLKERPDVVISTGAAPGLLICFWAKIFASKIVWVDSIANSERFSMSGRIVRKFAHVFITQWKELADESKGVVYKGELI